ncbi:MAG: CBS domain-containing protein [Candidatus Latescibacterota bacterium]|jgi:CBS domain-containing protein
MQTAEDIVRMKNNEIISVSPQATIAEALQIMVTHKIGAILVFDAGLIAGIWTERDLMRNTLLEGFDPQQARLGDYMVKEVTFASYNETIYELMDKFLGLRLRHLPVEKEGELIGLLSIGDVLKASLYEKTKELEKLNGMVSWAYYEEWRWDSGGVKA